MEVQDSAQLLEQLKQVEIYFIAWLKDKKKITVEEVPRILESLFKSINRIPIIITHDDEVDDDDHEENNNSNSLELRNILKDLSAYLVETFFYIHTTNQLTDAKQALDKATAYKNYCAGLKYDETLNYFIGIQYLIDLLQFHMKIADPDQQNSAATKKDDIINLGLPTIPNGLTDQGMAAILTAKWTLMNAIFTYRSIEVAEVLEKIARLDSEHWNWHYLICCRERAIRRNPFGFGTRSEPSQLEIQSSIKCLQLVPKHHLSKVIGASVQILAQLVRFRHDSRPRIDEFYKYGIQNFTRNSKIVDYIIRTIGSTINNEEKTTASTYVRYGEILSSILPFTYQNDVTIDLAEDCLTKSLEMKPKNSKANHRMGIFHQTKKKDMVKAQQYFEVAIQSNSCNFPAYMSLIPVLMRSKSIEDNFTKLGSIFDDIFSRPNSPNDENSFSKPQLWKFRFLQGVYFFKIDKLNEAFKLWTESYQDQENDDQLQKEFENLDKMQKRCLTTRGEFVSLKHIHQSLKTTNEEHQFDEIKEIIEKLLVN